ncbi:MAG: sensor histidine kinase [Gammaproteobacteria bacterium]|nr:sensor histidine kinase [Gammaproteobacteria bacterium]
MSPSGAAADAALPVSDSPDKPRTETCSYLPDLCAPMAVLGVILVAELVAIALALARQSEWVSFFADLGRTSIALQWLSLTSAAVLCVVRPLLAGQPVARGTALALGAVAVNLLVISEALYWAADWLAPDGARSGWLPSDHLFFATRNLAIGGIAAGALLRYFYISDQWQRNVRRQAEARVHALQARIRPHFLFNSMNTIASLTRSNPAAAEQAVEDLADLFRASLAESRQSIRLGDELGIARVYERMERQRLGERLRIEWQLDALPADAMIPSLTIQPLLENAIYHGVERLADPGTVHISGQRDGDMLEITLTNPVPANRMAGERTGNQIAIDNIRERLVLAFGADAGLRLDPGSGQFRVTLRFPYRRSQ